MARKSIVSSHDAANNGQVEHADHPGALGDAAEPGRVTDADRSFDPAELEAAGQAARQTVEPTPAQPANPFSREALRLSQSYTAALGLEKHIHNIPVDKPPSESWFRVCDAEDCIFDTYLLHIKNGPDRGVYQVSAELLAILSGERLLKPTRLVLCIDRQAELRSWPLRIPGPDGREDDWMGSALAIAEQAKGQWVRLVAGSNGYTSRTTRAVIPDPIWPSKTFDELLEPGFCQAPHRL